MEINKVLGEIGLNEKEAKVYLATLELGESTVLPIANKSDIKRTYCYDILADLNKKRLVDYFEKNGRRRYVATDPRKIETMIKEHLTNFQSALPELAALYKPTKEKPSVRFYEGPLGIREIYQELGDFDEILGYGNFDKIAEYFPDFYKYAAKQLDSGKKVRDLVFRSFAALELAKLYKGPKQELRFLPAHLLVETDTIIYGSKVAMISYGETVHGLVVESTTIAKTQRKIFEELWKLSSPD